MLYVTIQQAQMGNEDAMMSLISKFSGLTKKYGRKLGYEDAECDLVADFIELIRRLKLEKLNNTSDGAIVNFIGQSIYRAYLKRLSYEIDKKPSEVSLEDLTPVQIQSLQLATATELHESIESCFPEVGLSDKEIMVLTAIYEGGHSASALARQLNVSRQNVNQIKNRALLKLRKQF